MKNCINEKLNEIELGNIPEGYHKRKYGIFPEDWNEYSFDELFKFSGGLTASRANLGKKGVCYLHYGDIHGRKHSYLDVSASNDTIPKIDVDIKKVKESSILENGDIVFADASEDYKDIGKSIVIYNDTNIPFISGLHTIVAKDKTDLLDDKFKRYFIDEWSIRKQMIRLATGISVLGLSKANIKNIKVSIPSLEEQIVIGNILSNMDNQINTNTKMVDMYEKLLKSSINELTIQKSNNEVVDTCWEKNKLGNLGDTFTGLRNKSSKDFGSGKPYIPYLNIFKNSKVDCSRFDYVTISEDEKQYMVERGDVFFTISSETRKDIAMSSVILEDYKELYLNSFCFGYRLYDKTLLLPEYLRFVLRNRVFRSAVFRLAQGSTRYNISSKKVMAIEIEYPSVKIQLEVSELLNTIQELIDKLNRKIDILKDEKKSLQQLLTTGILRVKN